MATGIRTVLFGLGLALAAPTHAATQSATQAGAANAQHDGRVFVFDHADWPTSRIWTTKPALPTPQMPQWFAKETSSSRISICVYIAFFVEADGSVSQPRVLRAKTSLGSNSRRSIELSDTFAQALAASLLTKKFEPGPDNPMHLRGFTGATFGYVHRPGSDYKKNCDIPSLARFIADQSGDHGARP